MFQSSPTENSNRTASLFICHACETGWCGQERRLRQSLDCTKCCRPTVPSPRFDSSHHLPALQTNLCYPQPKCQDYDDKNYPPMVVLDGIDTIKSSRYRGRIDKFHSSYFLQVKDCLIVGVILSKLRQFDGENRNFCEIRKK